MSINKSYSYKIYMRSEAEYIAVRTMATRDGLGNRISTWIRDLIIAELRRRGMEGAVNNDQPIPRNSDISLDLDWKNKVVPHPKTGKLVRAGDIEPGAFGTMEEEPTESIMDIINESLDSEEE